MILGTACYLMIGNAIQEKADKEEEMKALWIAENTIVSTEGVKNSKTFYIF